MAHPLYRVAKQPRLYAYGGASQYLDSLVGVGSVGWDLGPVDFRAVAGGRHFFEWRSEGVAERVRLVNERYFLGGEIGRSFFGREMGALHLGWLQYPAAKLAYVTVNIDTATRFISGSEWRYRFILSYWACAMGTLSQSRGDWVHLISEVGKGLSENFLGASEVGLNVAWTYRATDALALGTGRHEMMTLALGPTLAWQGATGRWTVGVPFRMFLDSDVKAGKLTHPSVLGAPGFEVKWGPR